MKKRNYKIANKTNIYLEYDLFLTGYIDKSHVHTIEKPRNIIKSTNE